MSLYGAMRRAFFMVPAERIHTVVFAGLRGVRLGPIDVSVRRAAA